MLIIRWLIDYEWPALALTSMINVFVILAHSIVTVSLRTSCDRLTFRVRMSLRLCRSLAIWIGILEIPLVGYLTGIMVELGLSLSPHV